MTSRPSAVAVLPTGPGVYRFRDSSGHVLYIGRAADLRRRVSSYWGDLRGRVHLTSMVGRIAGVEAVSCDSEHEAAWLERNLLQHCLPHWNRAPAGGAEVSVFIRVDERSGRPGLTVVHLPEPSAAGVRHFGPYLGGARTRLAVSGLHRVLPLAYAGERLNGTALDFAKSLGVRPGDLDGLARTVTRVLERDLEAVAAIRADLARRQEQASRNLIFELAARIRDELAALEWVLSEQKVASQDAADADVYGLADGVLVHFGIRSGHLRTWTRRTCSAADAKPLLEATPPGWTAFAHRNAELAARLLGAEAVESVGHQSAE